MARERAADASPPAPPSASQSPSPPQSPEPPSSAALSVSLTDPRNQISVGEETEYTVMLRNEGPDAVEDIVLAQTAPEQLEFLTADGGGEIQGGTVIWRLSLDPGEDTTRKVTARLNGAAPDAWRVETTVCAGLESDDAPIACGTDSNLLRVVDESAVAGNVGFLSPLLVGAAGAVGVVVLTAASAALFVLRQRNRERRARAAFF